MLGRRLRFRGGEDDRADASIAKWLHIPGDAEDAAGERHGLKRNWLGLTELWSFWRNAERIHNRRNHTIDYRVS